MAVLTLKSHGQGRASGQSTSFSRMATRELTQPCCDISSSLFPQRDVLTSVLADILIYCFLQAGALVHLCDRLLLTTAACGITARILSGRVSIQTDCA